MFQIGDKIVHPMHGAGIIDDIETRNVSGVNRSYYVLRMPIGGMTVMIPTDNCGEIGVRPIIPAAQGEQLLEKMGSLPVDMNANWNHRYRENMVRLKSGDLSEVAQVVKGLMLRDTSHSLSTGERKMLSTAKQILISELALSQDCAYEEMERRVCDIVAVLG